MSDNLREQIYNNLILKETEDLLDIWQNGGKDEWTQETFTIIQEILLARLGYLPPQSTKTQVSQILSKVDEYLENGELEKGLSVC